MKPPRRVEAEKLAVAWVEVAPGLHFGVAALPSRWVRRWQRWLLGWTYRTRREP